MMAQIKEWWKNPDHRKARAEHISNMHLRADVLRMNGDRARRIVYELVSMDLNEDPLRGDELEDIILYDNDDYILMGSSGRKHDPLHMLTLSGPGANQLPLVDAEYESWLDAVQNSPDI